MEKRIKLYKGKVTILFEEERHRFKHLDGTPIDSVTSATGKLDKSGPLTWWATRVMGERMLYDLGIVLEGHFSEDNEENKKQWLEIPNIINEYILKKRKENEEFDDWVVSMKNIFNTILVGKKEHSKRKAAAADIGTEIHKLIERWIKGEKVEIPDDENIRNGYIAFLKFVKENEKLKITSSEQFIYSKKYDYAGIKDWDAEEDGMLVIGDNKSSKGIYTEMRYQLAGYWNASEEESGKRYEKGIIAKFGKYDGEFEYLEIPRREYKKDLKAFLGLLDTRRRERELGNW